MSDNIWPGPCIYSDFFPEIKTITFSASVDSFDTSCSVHDPDFDIDYRVTGVAASGDLVLTRVPFSLKKFINNEHPENGTFWLAGSICDQCRGNTYFDYSYDPSVIPGSGTTFNSVSEDNRLPPHNPPNPPLHTSLTCTDGLVFLWGNSPGLGYINYTDPVTHLDRCVFQIAGGRPIWNGAPTGGTCIDQNGVVTPYAPFEVFDEIFPAVIVEPADIIGVHDLTSVASYTLCSTFYPLTYRVRVEIA